jgi:cholesterol transport system auxiliary component
MRPSTHRAARVAAVTLTVAACVFIASCASLSRPATDRQLFAIDPGAPSASPAAPARPPNNSVKTASAAMPALRVRRLQVANPYAGTAFVYRTPGGAFRTDYYNGFIAPPAELLTGALVDWLSRAGGFATVTDAASTVPARYVLEGNVTALFGDYTDRKAPKAVIRIKIFVLDEQARGSRLAFHKEYEASAAIQPASVPSLVDGWNKALRSVLEQVQADLPSRLAPETSEQQALQAQVR